MIRQILRTLTFIALTAMAMVSPAQLMAQTLDTKAVDALVKGYGAPSEPGISLAIAKDGEVIYEGWQGLADVNANTKIDRKTRFHIASISKQFTAYAIHQLAHEGKLSLEQPISDFFPQMIAGKGKVTIRHLLDHTGGLREVNTLSQMLGFSDASPVTAEQALALILRQKGVNFEAGSDEEYSNTGYQLLAHIVAKASGQSFADFMQSRIFAPQGMASSFVHTDPWDLAQEASTGYEIRRGSEGTSFIHAPVLSTTFGSTGIVSTPRDLLQWGHRLNQQELADAPALQGMAKRSVLPDGRQVVAGSGQEFRLFRGVKTWSHGGTTAGYRSFLLRIPERGLVIAVAGNRADFLKAAFAFDVAEALLGASLEPAPQPDMSEETIAELDSYAGDYELFPGTVFSLRREGENLTFAGFGDEAGFALPRLSKGEFLLDPAREIRLVFRDFEDGRASLMRWQVSDDGFLRAPRVEMEPIGEQPQELSRYAGTFYSAELMMGFEVSAKEDGLWLASPLSGPVPLILYQPNIFRPAGPVPFGRIEFVTHSEGQIETIRIANPLLTGIEFQRTQ